MQKPIYWGALIIEKNVCPVCDNRLKGKFQTYKIYGTPEKESTNTELESLYCDICHISFINRTKVFEKNKIYVNGFRCKSISNKINLHDAKQFLLTPFLNLEKGYKCQNVTVHSEKTTYNTDEIFEFIFNNATDYNFERSKVLKLRNLLKNCIENWEFKKSRDSEYALSFWANIIKDYLPYGQTYTANYDTLKLLLQLMYTNKNLKYLCNSDDFCKKLKKVIENIIEKSYFSLNNYTQNIYSQLSLAKIKKDSKTVETIRHWFKTQYIKTMFYEKDAIYVNVYNGKLSCISQNHKIEERIGILKNIPDFEPVSVNLHYCHNCKEYSIHKYSFDILKESYNLLLFDLNSDLKYPSSQRKNNQYYSNLALVSKFKKVGYCVNKNDSPPLNERRRIIIFCLESGYTTKAEFSDFLSWLIGQNCNRENYKDAVYRWESDLQFINNYNAEKQSFAYQNLIFMKKSTIDSFWKPNFQDNQD